jgi:hypothetical protein
VKDSSKIGAVVVSIIVLAGFIVISFLAMKPESVGVNKDVVLFLLGSWSGLAGIAVAYWLGSSAGSADKSAQIERIKSERPQP